MLIISCRYFAAVFTASKTFPNYPGVASGASMALFGLSPLFLTLIATNFFTSAQAGLDVAKFLTFLSVFVSSTHMIGAFTLRIPTPSDQSSVPNQTGDLEETAEFDERSRLLPARPNGPSQEDDFALELLHDKCFWLLVLILVATLGSVSTIHLLFRNVSINFHAYSVRWLCLIWGQLYYPSRLLCPCPPL